MARSSIGRAMARSGGWGKAIKKKGKKRSKKGGKKRAKKGGKKRSKKRGSKKRSRVNKPVTRRSVRKNRPRKKGSKRRASTTTFKVSGLKAKAKCAPGKKARATSEKARVGGKTYLAIGTRCVAM